MSTKTWPPYRFMAILGIMAPRQVSHVDVWISIRPIYPLLLLRRTHKIWNYTDDHDVDEDLRTILLQGGMWYQNDNAGGTCRYMGDTPTTAWDTAASSDIRNWSNIIRIFMMSTKISELFAPMMEVGYMRTMKVSCIDIWPILLFLHPVLLLIKIRTPPYQQGWCS